MLPHWINQNLILTADYKLCEVVGEGVWAEPAKWDDSLLVMLRAALITKT